MNLTEKDKFKFIECVHSQPVLWNLLNKSYKNSIVRADIWKNIGLKFGLSAEEAQALFKSLREKYRREKLRDENATRSGSGLSQRIPWVFMEALRFLDDAYKNRKVTVSTPWAARSPPPVESHVAPTSPSILSGTTSGMTSLFPSSPSPVLSPTISKVGDLQNTSNEGSARVQENISVPTSVEGSTSNLMDCLSENTRQIIDALTTTEKQEEHAKPYAALLEYIRSSLVEMRPDDAKECERDLLQTVIKFKFK